MIYQNLFSTVFQCKYNMFWAKKKVNKLYYNGLKNINTKLLKLTTKNRS